MQASASVRASVLPMFVHPSNDFSSESLSLFHIHRATVCLCDFAAGDIT